MLLYLHNQTIEIVEKFNCGKIPHLKTTRGRSGGSWALEEIVYLYATYLSTEFHKAVIDAFTAAVHGNMVKVKEIVRTAVRQEGVPNSS
ncbi:hypothetical protein A4J64_000009 [Salmonella enterica subsp. enterica serovar Losangeles]|nr:hypothetical protein [Salmonella enterica subsp. enterica serovar Losangeles]